mgnify:CR=1 FL=1
MSVGYVEYPIPVHPSQARRAMHNLAAQGVPIAGGGMSGGDYVIVVVLPADAAAPDWRSAPAVRHSGFRFDTRRWLRWVAVLAVVAVLAGVLWFAFSPSDRVTAEVGGMRLDPATGHGIPDDEMWGWLPDMPALHLSWPWADAQSQPAEQGGGWQWPWDAAVKSAQDTVTFAAGAVLAVLVLLIVLALVRRRR